MSLPIRSATVERITNETKIKCSLSLDVDAASAKQEIDVQTGIGFLDHVSRRSGGSSCLGGGTARGAGRGHMGLHVLPA
jgi:hypothetical protein